MIRRDPFHAICPRCQLVQSDPGAERCEACGKRPYLPGIQLPKIRYEQKPRRRRQPGL